MKGTRQDIKTVVRIFKRKITQSIIRNKQFFKKYCDQIYIVSGGFKECIVPVVEPFSIAPSHILANTFKLNEKGQITGYDKNNPLSNNNGKAIAVKKLKLPGIIYAIGDGYTDYQIKQSGAAKYFIAFTENITRQVIIKNADYVVQNFDELLNLKYNKCNENHSSDFCRRNCV
ncbi:haloacid dehalogenase-like hydrolase [Candidatus Roizmanbacteria bacterium]|nr:haloacid dehalogenase-like hydrolase [Candidatus Roizmanbacteria bacterium]